MADINTYIKEIFIILDEKKSALTAYASTAKRAAERKILLSELPEEEADSVQREAFVTLMEKCAEPFDDKIDSIVLRAEADGISMQELLAAVNSQKSASLNV